MTIALLITLGVLSLAFLAILDRQGKRHHEERQAHRLEIAGLCQRIQAPELAVVEHAQRQPVNDDSYPLTDEQSAELQEQHRLAIERMEQLENEGLGLT